MKPVLPLLGLLALSAAAGLPALAQSAEEPSKGEIRLAKMLEGRVAGEPQSCISMLPNTDVTVIDGTAIVYRTGRTLYVNVPRNADALDDRDTMVRPTSMASQLCNTDIITTIDSQNGIYTGNISLSQFVPYRKAEN